MLRDPRHQLPRKQEAEREVIVDSATSDDPAKARRFRDAALPHLDAVYTLARYLLRNRADAEDAVQECYLRALRHFETLRSPDIKPWLFAILRNVCHRIRWRSVVGCAFMRRSTNPKKRNRCGVKRQRHPKRR
jgi:hypothetical protein